LAGPHTDLPNQQQSQAPAFSVHIERPLDASMLDFLLLVMRRETAPLTIRLDAAKNAAT
jgi:hypothetical protein